MKSIDIERLMSILREAAKAEILPRFRHLSAGMVRQKTSAVDLVTEADEAAERRIHAEVAKLAPDALFIGEESVAADPKLLDGMAAADLAVIIDPIDGTSNFASGLPLFGVMAAVLAKGETIAGIIYDPMGDDFVVAESGSGAWLRLPDGSNERLRAAGPVALEDMVGAASMSALPREIKPTIYANLAKLRSAAAYRCAAHEYRTLAGGHFHYLMFNKLLPWDHAMGALIAAEAGAYIARFDGSAYRPEHMSGGILVAPDKASWEMLRKEVFAV